MDTGAKSAIAQLTGLRYASRSVCGLSPPPLSAPFNHKPSDDSLSREHGEMMQRVRDGVERVLELFRSGPSLLNATLRQIPRQMWRYRPRPYRASIHDMVVELAESEAGVYVMSRQWIAQPNSPLSEVASRSRPRSPLYLDQTVLESLKIISYLRRSTYRLLCNLPDDCWGYTAVQPWEGSITLKQWLALQERHIPMSVQSMWSNHDTWIRMHPAKKTHVKSSLGSESSPESLEVK
jgi:hypothetical protein